MPKAAKTPEQKLARDKRKGRPGWVFEAALQRAGTQARMSPLVTSQCS